MPCTNRIWDNKSSQKRGCDSKMTNILKIGKSEEKHNESLPFFLLWVYSMGIMKNTNTTTYIKDDRISMQMQQSHWKNDAEYVALVEDLIYHEELLHMDGMDDELAFTLASSGIATMDDLAELSVDDLNEIAGLDDERAAKLIMTARAPWFLKNER